MIPSPGPGDGDAAIPRTEVEAILAGAGATLINRCLYDDGDRLHSRGWLAGKP